MDMAILPLPNYPTNWEGRPQRPAPQPTDGNRDPRLVKPTQLRISPIHAPPKISILSISWRLLELSLSALSARQDARVAGYRAMNNHRRH